jgi:hypothetical protein
MMAESRIALVMRANKGQRKTLMRTIVVAVMMVLLWAVQCPGADSGFKQGASEIGKGIKEGTGSEGSRSKDQERSRKGLSGDQGRDNGNQTGGPKAGPDSWRVVPGCR